MSERMSERLSVTMADICRYLENRFGRGATLSSQLTGLGFKALPSKGQSAISLLADTSAWASMRKARRCLAFGQRELFEVFAKFEPSADIDASGSNLDQNLDRADPDPIQIESHPEGDLARRLLATIRRNPLISRKLLAIELSVSERKIRDSLKILKDSGVIARQGPDHGGIWRISRRVAQNGVLKTGTSGVISKGRTGMAEAINEVINEAIRNEPGINKPRLVRLVGKSRAIVERAIVTLVAAGKIEHRGSKKTGGYYAI